MIPRPAALALLLACSAPPDGSPPGAPCPQADPQVAAYCWMRRGAATEDPEEAAAACARAGALAPDCRGMWVGRQLGSDRSTEVLLRACGPPGDRDSADCAFQVLDARPEDDLLAQLRACTRWASPFAEDCAVHALARWRRSRPGAEEVARVAAAGLFPQRSAEVVAAVIACQGTGDCGDHPALGAACREAIAEIRRRPSICAE